MKNILIKPVITEKSMGLAKKGVFSFFVQNDATKGAISTAIHEQFGVTVTEIKTLKTFKKIKRSMTKSRKLYATSGSKKALVYLEKGQKIPLFELDEEKKSKSKKKK